MESYTNTGSIFSDYAARIGCSLHSKVCRSHLPWENRNIFDPSHMRHIFVYLPKVEDFMALFPVVNEHTVVLNLSTAIYRLRRSPEHEINTPRGYKSCMRPRGVSNCVVVRLDPKKTALWSLVQDRGT